MPPAVKSTSTLISTSTRPNRRADWLLLLVTILAAISWMFSKEALGEFPPFLFICARFLMAGLLLSVPGWRGITRLSGQQWRAASGVGLIFGAAMSIWIMGLLTTSHLGEGSFITTLSVVMVPLVGWLIFRDRISRSNWVALPLAFIGLALLSLQHGFRPDKSQILFFIAALLLSLTFILNSRAAAHVPSLSLSAIQLSIVGLVALVLSSIFEDWPAVWTPTMWLWILLSITVGTAVRFFIQTYAQSMTSSNNAAVIMILEPVWTSIIAAMWFKEGMVFTQLLGCCCIFFALVANRWPAIVSWLRKSYFAK
ncbi:MAG: DMT family transporter [Oleibacter sp.]|nr:DMT family transporter [Thalassolituus sp.]